MALQSGLVPRQACRALYAVQKREAAGTHRFYELSFYMNAVKLLHYGSSDFNAMHYLATCISVMQNQLITVKTVSTSSMALFIHSLAYFL